MSLTKSETQRKPARADSIFLPPALTDQAEVMQLLAAGAQTRNKNHAQRRLRKVERVLAKTGPLDQAIEEHREHGETKPTHATRPREISLEVKTRPAKMSTRRAEKCTCPHRTKRRILFPRLHKGISLWKN